jgi:nonsense-mediated mRNA decay protein 3
MSFKKFCPKCGKETDKLVGKVCVDCFLKNKELFEVEKIQISGCKYCGRLFISGNEFDYDEEVIAEEVAHKTKISNELEQAKVFVELEKHAERDYLALVKVQGILAGKIIEQEKVVNFQIRSISCESCMKLNANYREAIIQLRARNERDIEAMFKLTQNLLEREKAKDSLSGSSKIVELKTGFDFWIGSKKAAAKISRELARIYHVKLKVSKKLIGEEQTGQRKYRHTFCIKLE